MKRQKVGIIVPVIEDAGNLRELTEIIHAQTLRNIETLYVIDDTLTADEATNSSTHSRCVVANDLSVAKAIKLGIDVLDCEYIMIVGSNDHFDEDMAETLYEKAHSARADIVLFQAGLYHERNGEVVHDRNCLNASNIGDREEFCCNDFPDGDLFDLTDDSVIGKLYSLSFLRSYVDSFDSEEYITLVALASASKICAITDELIKRVVSEERHKEYTSIKKTVSLDFIRLYDDIYSGLVKKELYTAVKQGFLKKTLNLWMSNINRYRNNKIVWSIVDGITASSIYRENIESRSEDDLMDIKGYKFILSLVNGKKWWLNFNEKKKSGLTARVIERRNSSVDPKVSVIVPVYNCGQYVEECIQSVQNQTLTDIEIICVDDGSTDDSLEILKRYSKTDERIVIISEKNGGQSIARNQAIDRAVGKYIIFLDSDDYIDENCLRELYEYSEKNELDVVFFDGETVCDDVNSQKVISDNYYIREHDYSGVYTGRQLMYLMEINDEYRVMPCMQMVRRMYLNEKNIRFEEGIIHEDNIYTLQVTLDAERAGYINKTFYKRRMRADSTMTRHVGWVNCYGYFISSLRAAAILDEQDFDSDDQESTIYDCLYRLRGNAIRTYKEIPDEEKHYYYYLSADEYYTFRTEVVNVVRAENELNMAKNEQARIKGLYKKEHEVMQKLDAKLQQTYDEKSELNAKLQQTYDEKSELNAKLQQTYDEKSELNVKLQQTYDEKSELNAKLQQTYDEKSELNAKLQRTYEEKSELNAKLKQTYEEKSELNAKLKKTYEEKSEINAKLKQTYKEKSERGVEIKELRQANSDLSNDLRKSNDENTNLSQQIEEAQNRNMELSEEIQKLKAESNTMKEYIDYLENKGVVNKIRNALKQKNN